MNAGRQDRDEVDAQDWHRLSLSFLAACLLLGTSLLVSGACRLRERPVEREAAPPVAPREPTRESAADPAGPESGVEARELPRLAGEPRVRVLLATAEVVAVRLERPALAEGRRLRARAVAVRLSGDRFVLTGIPRPLAGDEVRLRFTAGAGATFSLGDGGGGRRSYAGDLILVQHRGRLAVVEELPMERYLHGVIEKEVEPDWPLEALKAQAVAARSYATSKWMERHGEPWQLDASEQVDMAYAGYVPRPHVRLETAVEQTRGNLLWFAEQPLPAFFHAASGGRLADIRHVWPRRRCADGITSPAPAMPPRADPWAIRGERVAPKRLGHWRFRITYAELSRRLAAAGHDFGRIVRIRIADQEPGGRARSVRIEGSRSQGTISAHALRMACGSTRLKSTLWTDFRFSDTALVIEGRGYGHGIGLPQASAWAMARSGRRAPEILAQYYPGAALVKKW